MSKYKDAMEKFINIQPYISETIFGERYWEYENIVLEALEIADRLEKADAMTMAIGMECDSCGGGSCRYSEMYCDAVITSKSTISQVLTDIRGDTNDDA